MSTLREQLLAQAARFDEDGLVALANRGLLRRAQKDLEKSAVTVGDESAEVLSVKVADHLVRFDARGPAHAQCTCPATGVCQHVLCAVLALRQLAATGPAAPQAGVAADLLAPLRDALLKLSAADLARHAGKAGYRWAWQFVHDLEVEQAVRIGGEQYITIGFQRPRLTMRYMGGGIEALVADTAIAQVEKYRVAAVLAFQRAHGVEVSKPEPTGRARAEALDLGMDHRLAAPAALALEDLRGRFRASARQLLTEAVELGLAHLSRGVHERFATLAVWGQGADYPRLALLLRRIADHVDLLLERAGGADEHRLLDEMSLAFAILCALDQAAVQGLAPTHLVGQARTRYEESSSLELWGLGASAWRSASGYVGLTMLFWSPADQGFLSCTDARPQSLRGFDPVARYRAPGPWAGLGAPAQATGRKLMLTGAQCNAAGRLSAAERASATVLPPERQPWSIQQIEAWTSWHRLADSRAAARRSLLAESRPMQDWVFLRPARFGDATFDETRQTLCWPLLDSDGQCLTAELVYGDYTSHAIGRIEALAPKDNDGGTIVVARLRPGSAPLVAEPLSLIYAESAAANGQARVDALHFDAPTDQGVVPKLLDRLRRGLAGRSVADAHGVTETRIPQALRDVRHQVQRHAERGVAMDQSPGWPALLVEVLDKAASSGLSAFSKLCRTDSRAGEGILKLNHVCQQYEVMLGSQVDRAD